MRLKVLACRDGFNRKRASNAYRCPHHGNRSFTFRMTINVSLIMTPFPPIVILNGHKNAAWESGKAERRNGVKNLWLGWHLTAFPTTVTDPSHSFRMTINVFSHYDTLPWVLLYRQAREWLESWLYCLFNVILNGDKNAVWKSGKAERWHGVKNLLLRWQLTASAAFIKRRKNCQLTDDRSRLSICFLS